MSVPRWAEHVFDFPRFSWAYCRDVTAMAVIYFLATCLSFALASWQNSASAIWIPSGVALSALLFHGARLWPGILLGAFAANFSYGTEALPTAIVSAGSVLEAVVGVWLAKRVVDFRRNLARVRDIIALFFPIALGASALSASAALLATYLSQSHLVDSFPAWAEWWLGNATGIVIVTPLILTWYKGNIAATLRVETGPPRFGDGLIVLPIAVAFFTFVVLPTYDRTGVLLLLSIFPVIVWWVLTARLKSIALSNALIAVIAVVATATGHGPFADIAGLHGKIVQQGYVYAVALVALVLGAGLLEKATAEGALRESDNRFRSIWETTNDAVLIVDSESIIQYANPACKPMFGYAAEELVGAPLSTIQPHSLHAAHRRGIRRYVETGQKQLDWRGVETTARRRDGSELPVEIVFSELTVAGRQGFVGLIRDISRRRTADEELRQSQLLFATVFSESPVPIVFSRLADGHYFEANKACLRMFGFERHEVIGKTTIEIGIWPNVEGRAKLIELLTRDGRADELQIRLRRKSGEEIDVIYSAQLVDFAGDRCIVATILDISAGKRAEAERQLSEERFARIFHASPDAITISRLNDSVYVELNDKWVELCGFSRDELVGKSSTELGIWMNPERRTMLLQQLESDGRVREFEFKLRRKDGGVADTLMSSEVIELNGVACLLSILIDVTERNRTDRQLRDSERRFADVVDAAGEYVWETDSMRRFTYASSRVESVIGYTPAEMLGRTPASFMPPDEAERVKRFMAEKSIAEPFRNLEHIVITKDGRHIWQNVSGVPIFDAAGVEIGLRGTALDITARKLAEQRIEELATRDALTQLPNRRLLTDRLSQGLMSAQRSQGLVAVLFIDLDRFKTINDSLGHAAGDELLRTVAERLQGLMRKGDTLARIGGDEFVVVLEALRAAEDAAMVAQKIIAELSVPYSVAGGSVNCSASVGISVFPGDAQDGATLMRNADMAMYFAKEHGRRNYQFYSEEMNARAVEKLTLERTFRQAIEREDFVLYYHPKFDLRSGAMTGVEALVRWRHPELGIVGPASFIPVAEETGLIVPLGAWVLKDACRQVSDWSRRFGRIIPVAVNLSVGQFNKGLARTVRDALANAGVDAGALELEITESMLMTNADDNIETLRQLSALGVAIAIDDFGTGYSSLAYLRRFHVDTLKIDQTFVRDVENNLDDAAIIEAIIALGHSLKLTVVAEGVETTKQQQLLAGLNCDQCQGFLFCEPLPAVTFEARYLQTQ